MVRNYVPRKVSPRRSLRISVWVSDVEKTTVEEAAAIEGVSVAQFIRDVTLGAASATLVEETERLRDDVA
jgi:uncharacterized protein (DUF1778 family)